MAGRNAAASVWESLKNKSFKHWLFILGWSTIVYLETIYSTKMIVELTNLYMGHLWGVVIVLVGMLAPFHGGYWDLPKDEFPKRIALFPLCLVGAVFIVILTFAVIPLTFSEPLWLQALSVGVFALSCVLLMSMECLILPRGRGQAE